MKLFADIINMDNIMSFNTNISSPTIKKKIIYLPSENHEYLNSYFNIIEEEDSTLIFYRTIFNEDVKEGRIINIYKDAYTCLVKYYDNKIFFINPNSCLHVNDDIINNTIILHEMCASQNFSVFKDSNPNRKYRYIGIGGLVFSKETLETEIKDIDSNIPDNELIPVGPNIRKCKNIQTATVTNKSRANGLYLYGSNNGTDWKILNNDIPIIGGMHNGFFDMRTGYNEYDSNIPCFYWEKKGMYMLYCRSNISNGKRFIQYASSKDLINWNSFDLLELDPPYEFDFAHNYYSYSFGIYNDHIIAILPSTSYGYTVNPTAIHYIDIDIYISSDGRKFNKIYSKRLENIISQYYVSSNTYINDDEIRFCVFEKDHDRVIYDNIKKFTEYLGKNITKENIKDALTKVLSYEKVEYILDNSIKNGKISIDEICNMIKKVSRSLIEYSIPNIINISSPKDTDGVILFSNIKFAERCRVIAKPKENIGEYNLKINKINIIGTKRENKIIFDLGEQDLSSFVISFKHLDLISIDGIELLNDYYTYISYVIIDVDNFHTSVYSQMTKEYDDNLYKNKVITKNIIKLPCKSKQIISINDGNNKTICIIEDINGNMYNYDIIKNPKKEQRVIYIKLINNKLNI